MAQVKEFTAKKDLQLDCGHAVKTGESFEVTSVYTCKGEASWPLKVLQACLRVKQKEQK